MKWIKKIWKDNVIGSLIATGIAGLISLIWNLISPEMFQSAMKYNLPVWVVLISIFLVIIFSAWLFRRKREQPYIYTAAAKEIDKQSFDKLTNEFLSENPMLKWVRYGELQYDFPIVIQEELEDGIMGFADSKNEFLHPDIDAQRWKVYTALHELAFSFRIWVHKGSQSNTLSFQVFFSQTSEGIIAQQKHDEIMSKIDSQKWNLALEYDELVRVFRREQTKL